MLEIVIPTYNRVNFINDNITFYQDVISKYDWVCVSIIDNCSTGAKFNIPKDLISNKQFRFIRNETNVGGVKNIIKSFRSSRHEWIWVIPDDILLSINKFECLIPLLSDVYDIIVTDFKSSSYNNQVSLDDCHQYLSNLFLHCSWLPTVIYRRSFVSCVFESCGLNEFEDTSYPHLSILISSIKNKKVCNVGYINDIIVAKKHCDHRYAFVSGAVFQFFKTVELNLGLYTAIGFSRSLSTIDEYKKSVWGSFKYEFLVLPLGCVVYLFRLDPRFYYKMLVIKLISIPLNKRLLLTLLYCASKLLNILGCINESRIQNRISLLIINLKKSVSF